MTGRGRADRTRARRPGEGAPVGAVGGTTAGSGLKALLLAESRPSVNLWPPSGGIAVMMA